MREGRLVKIVLASRRELNFRRSQGVDSEPNCVRSVIKILLKNRHQKYTKIHHFVVPFGSNFGIILEPWMPHGTPGAPDGHLGSIFEPWVPPLGPLWGSFGLLWGPLGALLGAFGSPLGTFWLHFGHPGTTFETFSGVLASLCSP